MTVSQRRCNAAIGSFSNHHRSALRILATDPYNRSREHHIKKLEDVREGEGQYRLALGRWRFRYDILGTVVLLGYCGLRRVCGTFRVYTISSYRRHRRRSRGLAQGERSESQRCCG
jgi:hypothetical protein